MLLELMVVFNFFIVLFLGFEIEVNVYVNRVFIIVFVSLLLLGIFFIIGIFIVWKDFRLILRRILVYILISDFFIVGGNLFGVW